MKAVNLPRRGACQERWVGLVRSANRLAPT